MQTTALKRYHPLSRQQARLWALQGESQAFSAQCTVWLTGAWDIATLLQALQHLVKQHEILRTAFHLLPGMEIPVQVVTSQIEVHCPVIDLQHLPTTSQTLQLDKYFACLTHRVAHFEMSSPLFVELIRLTSERHLLHLCLPALCADGYTLTQIVSELSQIYAHHLREMGQDDEPLQYVDVAEWQEQILVSAEEENLGQYWRKIDLSRLETQRLPFEQESSTKDSQVGVRQKREFAPFLLEVPLEESLAAQISHLAQYTGVSIDAWFLACWEAALRRLGGEENLVIGVACHGRHYEELTDVLGPCTRFVPIKAILHEDIPFDRVLTSVNQSLWEAVEQQTSFAWKDNASFFPICFEHERWPASFAAGELNLSLYRRSCCTELFALKLSVLQVGEHLQLELHTDPQRISSTQIRQLARVLRTLIRGAVEQPQVPVSMLPLLEPDEQVSLLAMGRASVGAYPCGRPCGEGMEKQTSSLHRLFEEQARRQPNQLAVISAKEQLTYQQLNEQANRLARVLRKRGVEPNVLVGLCMTRGAQALVGLLGIQKAGGAYMPLDPASPPARITHQLQESQALLLLTQQEVCLALPEWIGGSTLCLEDIEQELSEAQTSDLLEGSEEGDLAYVIYTSGSTGVPKGVMIRHSSVINYTLALCELLAAKPGWQYAMVSTLAADLGNTAIFCALTSGGCVQVLDSETVTDASAMIKWAEQHPIDVLKIVSSHLSGLLMSEDAQKLMPGQALVLGGEVLPVSLLERLQELGGGCKVFNHYGPTETTIGVLVGRVGTGASPCPRTPANSVCVGSHGQEQAPVPTRFERSWATVPLGKPIANTEVYVLDSKMQLVPVGVTGELYIGGAGLAMGYVGQTEQTAERFVPHPFVTIAGARLYRTGDLARYDEEGNIAFVGRGDGQVKLRGYRIELAEIEAVLRQHPQVRNSVVVLREDVLREPCLVAYVVARRLQPLTTEQLHTFLRQFLPEYMVPTVCVQVDAFPLTMNGKVDRQKLPVPVLTPDREQTALALPRSPIEEMLVEIWSNLLAGVAKVGIHDNFFALGGHSLLAMRVIHRVQAVFQIALPVQMLFEAPTVAGLAQRIEQTLRENEAIVAPLLATVVPPLEAVTRPEEIPLSFAQQRLWFLDQLEPGSTAYLVPRVLHLDGRLDLRALEQSFQELVHRHEILRTTFEERAGYPVQVLQPTGRYPLPIIDLQELRQERRKEERQRLASEEAQCPCDLTRGPLLRTHILRLSQQEHILLLTLHHIITDGWSNGVLVREFTTLYRANVSGQPSLLAPLPIQYADYALWQRERLQGDVLDRQLAYWRKQLAGVSPLELPTDHPRPAVQTHRGAGQERMLPEVLSLGLMTLSQQEQVTLFMLLLAAFQVLLARLSQQRNIAVGTPIANRNHTHTEALIGFFVNTLVLRTHLADNPTFRQLLKQVRKVALEAYAHQDLPFEQVVDMLQPERDLSRSPLLQVMFVLQNASPGEGELVGVSIKPLLVESATSGLEATGVSKFDLVLFMAETGQGLSCSLEYNTDLFEAQTITRLLMNFQTLLEGIVQNPQARISDLPLLAEAERNLLLVEWNATKRDYPQDVCVHQLFEQQVERTPDAVALATGEEETLTYDCLDRRANQLAHHLQVLGVGPEVLVGICMERSVQMVIALLGVLKAGGTYVPLDPELPKERLAFIIQEACIWVLLTQENLRDLLSSEQGTLVYIERERESIARQSASSPEHRGTPEQLAYVLYTSGSTGQPKGVMVPHRGLVNYLYWARQAYAVPQGDGAPLHSPMSFDLTVTSLFVPLITGQRVLLLPENKGVAALASMLGSKMSFNLVKVTPSHLELLRSLVSATQFDEATQILILGGEAFSYENLSFWQNSGKAIRLFNEYGPTETVVGCCIYEVPRGVLSTGAVPIGQPIANVQVYLLDQYMQPVPVGVSAELYVGGVGITRGYLGHPEQTAERFIPDPFSQEAGARLYRTGDLARYLPDGNIEFLGRRDQQVKLRGYRIELGEIEAVLRQHEAVQDCVVLVREEKLGEKRLALTATQLVAYTVVKQNHFLRQAPDRSLPQSLRRVLRSYLQERLPAYMIPSAFVPLDAFPLTPNGKLNRRALPAPSLQESPDVVAPRTALEQALATLWAEVLCIKEVGIHDNFFELGGDSILSLQIIARARQKGLHFSLKQLFQYQTIGQLSQMVQTETNVLNEQGDVLGSLPLTPIQQWFFDLHLLAPHHWNQALFLQLEKEVESSMLALTCPLRSEASQIPLREGMVVPALVKFRAFLQEMVYAWLKQHDVLRLRFTSVDGEWRQEFGALDPNALPFVVINLSEFDETEQNRIATQLAAQTQASLDLMKGPLLRVVLFERGKERPNLLLLVIHHLLIDGVSWRILLEDMQIAREHVMRGKPIRLPAKTNSFKTWAQHLVQYAQSNILGQELSYWLTPAATPVCPLPQDLKADKASHLEVSAQVVSVRMTSEETRALLQEVSAVYHTQINEVLLTALALTLKEWTLSSSVLMDLEGHGREDLFEDVDVSRTVGWFTAVFPMQLDLTGTTTLVEALKAVKEQLRSVPHHGIGYGILRYLSPDPTVREQLKALPSAEISFNYLGQFDQARSHPLVVGLSPLSAGPAHHPQERRSYLLDMTCQISNNQLGIAFGYSQLAYRRSTIERLANRFTQVLHQLVYSTQAYDAGALTPSDFLLAPLQQPLLDQIQQQVGDVGLIEDIYPLSPMQEGLLFHALYEPSSPIYLTQMQWQIEGSLQVEVLQQAFQQVIERHSVLRTRFLWEGVPQPLQIVQRHVPLPWTSYDWQDLDEHAQQTRLSSLLQEDRERGFDLRTAPLLRLTLVQLHEQTFFLVLSHHHILLDGWSQPLLLAEVQACYQAASQGKDVRLANVRPYRDYIAWVCQSEQCQAEQFWRTYLAGLMAPNRLPGYNGTPNTGRVQTAKQQFQIAPALIASLRELARQQQLTLNTLFQGAWALLLSRYSGEKDVIFGATVTGRSPELMGVETMIGLFINTLPVRIRIVPDISLSEWLHQLQTEQVQARQYEYTPLVQIQTWSQVPAGQPLFESLMLFQNYPVDISALEQVYGLTFHRVSTVEQTHYPLALIVSSRETGGSIALQYDETRFEDVMIMRVLQQLQVLLYAMIAEPEQQLGNLPFLSEKELHQQLVEWNATKTDFPQDRCVHQLFEEQVQRTPDAVALVFECQTLTYAELNRRANQLGHHLQKMGLGPDGLVGICMQRSVEMVMALLGVLKAGGAYLALDPSDPAERLIGMLEEAQPLVILTQTHMVSTLSLARTPLICLETHWQRLSNEASTNPVSEVSGEHLVYLIYTSGSTGKPKGVMNTHRGLLNRLWWMQQTYGLTCWDRVVQKTPFNFDVSVWEFFWPLMTGASLVIALPGGHRDPSYLKTLVIEQEVTTLHFVPSMLHVFLQERDVQDCGSLRHIFCSGEALSLELQSQFFATFPERVQLQNLYGPTEASIDVTSWSCMPEDGGHQVPIGYPIANTQIYLLDKNLQPVPVGVTGEIYLGGVCLARGYLRQAELTAERFVPNPFVGTGPCACPVPGARLYRTGDHARYSPDGQLEFLGRQDQQVKIRGIRVELGEIEAVLLQHPTVHEAVVLVQEDTEDDKRLIAYLVLQPEQDGHRSQGLGGIKAHLRTRLPESLLPNAFVLLEHLPLLSNGKLDRHALPQVEQKRLELLDAYVAPRTPIEEILVSIWDQVLKLERVGIHENFFELGGHSLLAIQLIARVRAMLGVEVSLRALFEAQTIAEFAQRVEHALGRGERMQTPPLVAARRPEEIPLSFAQQRLWFLDQLEPGSTTYLIPNAYWLRGVFDVECFERSLEELTRRHESLHTTFLLHADQPAQVIHPVGAAACSCPMHPVIDLQAVREDERTHVVHLLVGQEARHPMDLTSGPLLRTYLLRLSMQEHVLLLTLHHIIIDDWSTGVLVRELTTLYRAHLSGQSSPLPPLPIQYADYALWQRQWLQGEVLQQHVAYWKKQLWRARPLELPTDVPPTTKRDDHGATYAFTFPTALSEELIRFSRQEGATLFMVLLTAFQVLFYRLTGQRDLIVGTDIAGRTHVETEGIIGFFVNLLALRTDVQGTMSFREVVQQVKAMVLGAYTHQEVPFDLVVEHLQVARSEKQTPLVQVLFVLQNAPRSREQLPGITLEPVQTDETTAKFDLALFMSEEAEGLGGRVVYRSALFKKKTIALLVHRLEVLVRNAIAGPDTLIDKLEISTDEEQTQQANYKKELYRAVGTKNWQKKKANVVDLSEFIHPDGVKE